MLTRIFGKQSKIIFCVLFIAGIFGGLLLFATAVKAILATSSVTVTNSLPVASLGSINTDAATMTLTEAATATATFTFTVTDNNGCSDINAHGSNKTIAKFYRTNVADGAACAVNDANCYAMTCTGPTGCTPGGGDLDATFSCTASVQFYADPTDTGSTYDATTWSATATPRDAVGTDGTPNSDTIEMASLTALSLGEAPTIAYDALALNANTGTTDETTTVTNTGNRTIDTQVGGYGSISEDTYSMVCTIGTIPVANEKYSLVAETAYASKTALVTNATPNTVQTSLAQGAASTDIIYWGMGLPATGVGGTCGGKVVFTAVNDS